MNAVRLPIEDTFGDILRKAMRGTKTNAAQLSKASGVSEAEIALRLKDAGEATPDEARALAAALRLDGDKMVESAAQAWYPPPIERPDIRRHAQHPHPSNGYVIVNREGRAALVDPAGTPRNLLRVLRDGDYDLQYVLITHKHDDHCDAAGAVAEAYPEARIVMHPLDVFAIGSLAANAIPANDGAMLPFGDETAIRVLHTPGHTDGSVCYLFDGAVFTGDTLFAASVGGAFGDESTYADILESVGTKLFTLAGETDMMPGHGPPTTMALARAHNAFFSNY